MDGIRTARRASSILPSSRPAEEGIGSLFVISPALLTISEQLARSMLQDLQQEEAQQSPGPPRALGDHFTKAESLSVVQGVEV